MTPADLVQQLEMTVEPEVNILVIKETSIDLEGVRWLSGFLQHNAANHRIKVVWSLRCYRHTYLSFVEGARVWWGHEDLEVGVDGYDRWVERARASTAILLHMYQQFPGAVYSYETLTANPAAYLPKLMSELELEYSDQLLDYSRHFSPEQVHGDVGMAENPRPISSQSVEKREQEWREHAGHLADAARDPLRCLLDEFWQAVETRGIVGGTLASEMLPPGLGDANQNGAAGMTLPPAVGEYRVELGSRQEWTVFVQQNPAILDSSRIDECADHIAENGFRFRGRKIDAPLQLSPDRNYREGFNHAGLNSRKRAVLAELYHDLKKRKLDAGSARVYAPEALGGFAKFLTGEFPGFRGSEYIPDPALQEKLAPVEHQDLAGLSYANDSFDYVLVNDIFEHVPALDVVLSEIARVLAPGGVLLSTFPFALKHDEHLVKARLLDDGNIEYLTEPEYHEDPVDEQGVLVFQVPGWNILQECQEQGFADASIVFLASPSRGILANNISGIMLLKACMPGATTTPH